MSEAGRVPQVFYNVFSFMVRMVYAVRNLLRDRAAAKAAAAASSAADSGWAQTRSGS